MTLTRPLDRGLVTAALNRGARNTARACLQLARREACKFEELLFSAEAGS